jgi:hypothetical protein
MNWKGRQRTCPRYTLRYYLIVHLKGMREPGKFSATIAGLRTDNQTLDLPNAKELKSVKGDVQYERGALKCTEGKVVPMRRNHVMWGRGGSKAYQYRREMEVSSELRTPAENPRKSSPIPSGRESG